MDILLCESRADEQFQMQKSMKTMSCFNVMYTYDKFLNLKIDNRLFFIYTLRQK